MKVLVTGGAGYIGSHTAKMLELSGHSVFVFDNLERGHEWALKWGAFVKGDLMDEALLANVLRENKIEGVVHFAAHSLVGESVEKPELYFKNNILGTLNLLNAMKTTDVKRLVFSSTAAVYGNPKEIPIKETHPQEPINPYGETKLFMEKAMQAHEKAYGLKWIALRYFNAAGADPGAQIGEDHNPESHLIPIILDTVIGKRDHIDIYGTDYDTPDGTAVRDYIHVTDLADAHLKALGYLDKQRNFSVFNLGTGTGYSVREVIKSVEAVTGKKVPLREAGRRAGDPPSLVADASRAKEELKWRPRYSDLQTIIKTAWEWHKNKKA